MPEKHVPGLLPASAASRWADAALLVVGHGSASVPRAGEGLLGHAARLRAAGAFREVGAAFLNGEPTPEAALDALGPGTTYVVPFFMGEGYFTKVAVPRRLGLASAEHARNGRRFRYCAPVGCNPRFASLLAWRAREACRGRLLAPGSTVLLLIGHGNPHSSESSAMLRAHAGTISATHRFAAVQTAFIEEPPLAPEALRALAGRDAVVIAALAGEGVHAVDDVPGFVSEEEARRRESGDPGALVYVGVIGPDPAMAGLVLDQVRAFDRGRPGAVTPPPLRQAGPFDDEPAAPATFGSP